MKKKDSIYTLYWFLACLTFFILGIFCGIVYQQMMIKASIIDFLSSSNFNIEINFNETKLVQEMNQTIIPRIKEAVNSSICGKEMLEKK